MVEKYLEGELIVTPTKKSDDGMMIDVEFKPDVLPITLKVRENLIIYPGMDLIILVKMKVVIS